MLSCANRCDFTCHWLQQIETEAKVHTDNTGSRTVWHNEAFTVAGKHTFLNYIPLIFSDCCTKWLIGLEVFCVSRQQYLSLSAMKMTLLSSRREANTCRSFPTLRHCRRLSKSTCSNLESTGRHKVSTWQSNRSTWSFYIHPFKCCYRLWASGGRSLKL